MAISIEMQALPRWRSLIWLALPPMLFMVSLTWGRYPIAGADLLQWLIPSAISGKLSELHHTIIVNVRLPRLLAAMLVGGALSLSGSTFQGLFRNPMVSPDLLGASAGAGLGASLGLLFSLPLLWVNLLAFAGGLMAVAATCVMASLIGRGGRSLLLMVLCGMVISTLCAAFISLTKYLADPYSKLPEITFWLMGGLSGIDADRLIWMALPLLLGALPLLLLRWRLDLLSFGDEEASAMGVPVAKLRLLFIVCATLLTSASVSACGMIGWIGLLIPHLTRMIVGAGHRQLLPASLIVGSCFLLMVDNLARCALPVEVPLGILTAIIGAPFFLYLLLFGRRSW